MSLSPLLKASLAAGFTFGALFATHLHFRKFLQEKKKDKDTHSHNAQPMIEISCKEAIVPTPLSMVMPHLIHLTCAGFVTITAWGTLYSAQHIESIKVLRRCLIVALPVTGIANVIVLRKQSEDEFHIADGALKDPSMWIPRIAHMCCWLPVAAAELFYDMDAPESNKNLIRLACAAVTCATYLGKHLSLAETYFLGSIIAEQQNKLKVHEEQQKKLEDNEVEKDMKHDLQKSAAN